MALSACLLVALRQSACATGCYRGWLQPDTSVRGPLQPSLHIVLPSCAFHSSTAALAMLLVVLLESACSQLQMGLCGDLP